MTSRTIASAACLLLVACASAQGPARSGAEPLDLALALPDGRSFALASLRGKPALLFLFATYDTASQLTLMRLEAALLQGPEIAVLGVALQPDAQAFLELYRETLSVSFMLSYDPRDVILHGESALGRIAGVPMLVSIDARGYVVAARYGVPTQDELRALLSEHRH